MSIVAETIGLDVFRKYAGLSLPRHVSYPMPTAWHEIDPAEAAAMHRDSRERTGSPGLSLYLHVPFCERLCMYCACTRVIQPKRSPEATQRTEAYVAALTQEIHQLADVVGRDRVVRQVHWGGGTPTYLPADVLRQVQETIGEQFPLSTDAEIAIELDPRTVSVALLEQLRLMGVGRVSLGVQDFDQQVQRHVHRVQPFELIREVVTACREVGFKSINLDLIYGLPYQTRRTIADTVIRTIELSPDRIAFYHYALVPEKVATQRGLDHGSLPDSEEKLEMLLFALDRFEEVGYRFIGLDHFAKPDEALAAAADAGTLQRNFQGMTTGGGLDLVGIGASSITHLADVGFLQNHHDVSAYLACASKGFMPVARGKRLSFDDRIRQAVISRLYCYARIEPAEIQERFDVVFPEYFARELASLAELEQDGLIALGDDGRIEVLRPLGRVLLRNVAGVFDGYLDPDAYRLGDRRCFSASA